MIASFDKDDAHHAVMKDPLRGAAGRLVTTWPVVTETSHMLDFDARAQRDVYRWMAAGGITIRAVPQDALTLVAALHVGYNTTTCGRPCEASITARTP